MGDAKDVNCGGGQKRNIKGRREGKPTKQKIEMAKEEKPLRSGRFERVH